MRLAVIFTCIIASLASLTSYQHNIAYYLDSMEYAYPSSKLNDFVHNNDITIAIVEIQYLKYIFLKSNKIIISPGINGADISFTYNHNTTTITINEDIRVIINSDNIKYFMKALYGNHYEYFVSYSGGMLHS